MWHSRYCIVFLLPKAPANLVTCEHTFTLNWCPPVSLKKWKFFLKPARRALEESSYFSTGSFALVLWLEFCPVLPKRDCPIPGHICRKGSWLIYNSQDGKTCLLRALCPVSILQFQKANKEIDFLAGHRKDLFLICSTGINNSLMSSICLWGDPFDNATVTFRRLSDSSLGTQMISLFPTIISHLQNNVNCIEQKSQNDSHMNKMSFALLSRLNNGLQTPKSLLTHGCRMTSEAITWSFQATGRRQRKELSLCQLSQSFLEAPSKRSYPDLPRT